MNTTRSILTMAIVMAVSIPVAHAAETKPVDLVPKLSGTSIDDSDTAAFSYAGNGWQTFAVPGNTHHKGTGTATSTRPETSVFQS